LALGALAAATPALALIEEIGKAPEPTPPPPSCPGTPCLAVSRTTGFQAKIGETKKIYVAKRDAKLVAWTITLAKPGAKQQKFFEDKLGGPAAAQISVLRPGAKLRYRVVATSPVVELTPYFGMTAQFPLDTALDVKKGYYIALTVPTWAPALAVGLDKNNIWRASRPKGSCDDTATDKAQKDVGALAQYRCLYRGVRLTYSATLISTP
jgi:hypothetical protein